jgi:hypothetical protein
MQPVDHPAALLDVECLRAGWKPGFMNNSAGHAKVSTFLKIIAESVGLEDMRAALRILGVETFAECTNP